MLYEYYLFLLDTRSSKKRKAWCSFLEYIWGTRQIGDISKYFSHLKLRFSFPEYNKGPNISNNLSSKEIKIIIVYISGVSYDYLIYIYTVNMPDTERKQCRNLIEMWNLKIWTKCIEAERRMFIRWLPRTVWWWKMGRCWFYRVSLIFLLSFLCLSAFSPLALSRIKKRKIQFLYFHFQSGNETLPS